ncbi:hypothetical protein GCM10025860_26340 [Methanobacterium ferruginis]|nr:hypothetical protein GCM10025860_26340 [Methanobacterium ferruginis]
MNESKFAHITKAHPCFNEKMHDKVGRVHLPIAPAVIFSATSALVKLISVNNALEFPPGS